MKMFLQQLTFPSTTTTYIKDITDTVQLAITKSQTKNGHVMITTKHTTLGVIVNEIAEPNLLQDVLRHSLQAVPEDRRCTKVGMDYQHPTVDYLHRCQDNPYCDEIDEDYNAASHIRALTLSHNSVTVPYRNGKLELGKYQQIAFFEFDGRDGTGKNPIRQRTIQIWVYPAEELVILD